MDGSGNMYGTSIGSALSGVNYVYEVAKGSGKITPVASISVTDGLPVGGLILDSSGNLYGTTETLGGVSGGIVYALPQGSNSITTLATFNNSSVVAVGGLTIDNKGNLYGTTGVGGAGFGTIFELAKGSNTITTLASFNGTNGELPSAGVTLDSSGNLYGTTDLGGTNNEGTVFELANGSSTITSLASFTGANGSNPVSRPVLDSSGDLLGTTAFPSGVYPNGTIFEWDRGSSTISTVAVFDGANGTGPDGYPILDSSGNLYGTTVSGGSDGLGTVYELQAVAPGPFLSFVQPLNTTAAGAAIASVGVTIDDQFGAVETGVNGDKITVGLTPGSPSTTLHGTTTQTASNGEATFNDLSINLAANGYILAATTSTGKIIAATSSVFDIVPAAADHLLFQQGPSNTVVGAVMTPVVATLEDKYDNIETGDSTDQISLSLTPGGSLKGTTVQTVGDGEASFSDLTFSQAGNGFTLTANTSASRVNSLTSNSFNVAPAQVATTAVGTTVEYNPNAQTVTLNATLADNSVPNNTVNEGTVIFTVMNGQTVIGTPVQGKVSGGTASADITLPAGQAVGNYTLAVSYSDSQGNYIDSGDTNAALILQFAPKVTVNPTDQNVAAGQLATFTAAAGGTPPPTMQWQVSSDGGKTFSYINRATSTTLTLTASSDLNNNKYRALFANIGGSTYTSAATLTVVFAPVVTSNPISPMVIPGQSVVLTAAANSNPAATVQWQVSSDGGKTWSNISGATSTTLTLSNVSFALNGHQYQAVFTNSEGARTTNAATIIFGTAPTITSGSNADFSVGQGGNFTVTTTGSPSPNLIESGALPSGVAFTDNGNGTATLSGAPAAGTSGTYYITITALNGFGNNCTQSFALIVNAPPLPVEPSVLQLIDGLLSELGVSKTLTVSADGTQTVTDSIFGLPLLVIGFDSSGNFLDAVLLGLDITFLIEHLS